MKRNIKSILKFAMLSAVTVVFTVLLYRLFRRNLIYDFKLNPSNLIVTINVSIKFFFRNVLRFLFEFFLDIYLIKRENRLA